MSPLSPSQRETLEEATAAYEWAVTDAAEAWLRARGIDQATAVTFRLGVVADPFPGHERQRDRLAIPYLDHQGKPLSIRFRCIEDHDHREFFHGKYMSMTDEPARVFNVGAIHRAGDVIHITEGEFDAMILSQLGLDAVAIPGVQAWRGHHRRMLAGFSRTWVWGDPDDAGADFINKVVRQLRSAKGVRLREGDVTDTYLKGGSAAIYNLIGGSASE